jgi:hypothetical protein
LFRSGDISSVPLPKAINLAAIKPWIPASPFSLPLAYTTSELAWKVFVIETRFGFVWRIKLTYTTQWYHF